MWAAENAPPTCQGYRNVAIPRTGVGPETIVGGIHLQAAHGAKIVLPRLDEVRNFTILGDLHDLSQV
jgi:hypothetical protein